MWGSEGKPWPVAVSDLDGYAYYAGPGIENGMTAQEFLRRLNRVEPANAAMLIGTAFHDMVERAQHEHVGFNAAQKRRQSDAGTGGPPWSRIDFNFDFDCPIPKADIVEMEVLETLKTASGWCDLRGVVDGLTGKYGYELKTTKSVKFERYQDSWQWRAYLHMTGQDQFKYHVFRVQYGRNEEAAVMAGKPVSVRVTEHEEMNFYRYPNMVDDLRGQCGQLVAFMDSVGWQPPEKRPMMAI